jgi:sulfur carrier protein ThiS
MAQDHGASCPPQTTVEALLRQLGYPEQQLLSVVPFMAGKRVPMSQVLRDGDAIDILAPAGGG